MNNKVSSLTFWIVEARWLGSIREGSRRNRGGLRRWQESGHHHKQRQRENGARARPDRISLACRVVCAWFVRQDSEPSPGDQAGRRGKREASRDEALQIA